MRSLVISIFLYACESWTLTADTERRIRALEMRCFRKLLNINYSDHITNEEVKRRIQQKIGPYKDLLNIVKSRKLKWYGHVTRSTGLAKTILQGTVPGGRRKGRQKKKWEDNIREWTWAERHPKAGGEKKGVEEDCHQIFTGDPTNCNQFKGPVSSKQ